MRRIIAISFLTLVLGISATTAPAATLRIPLQKLAPVSDVKLEGARANTHFSIPIPQRWKVNQAKFHFSYTNSSALIPQTSRLVFTVHHRPLAQITLNPKVPVGEVTVDIPGELLRAGYNLCRFEASQHFSIDVCEDPFSPELWTWINLDQAYFVFDVAPLPVPRRVSAVSDFLFDPRNVFDTSVNLIIPELSPDNVQLAMVAAAGVALRYDYRPVDVALGTQPRAGQDNVLIGLTEDIQGWLRAAAPDVDGPVITIQNGLPNREAAACAESADGHDPYHANVVVSGTTRQELALAVKAFASLSFPFPDAPTVKVVHLDLPQITRRMLRNGLFPGRTYSLAGLNTPSILFQGINPPPMSVNLRLPSDVYPSPNQFVRVALHMAYDAAMRSDSVLNIKVNEKFISSIRLDNPRGDYYKGYQIDIPFSTFKPGLNQLVFEPVLTPLHTDRCTLIQTDNLRLTLFNDSTIALPEAPYWIKMPQINLFFEDAFPFGTWPDLRDTVIIIPDETIDAAAAAVNLVTIAAQKIGYPPFQVTCRFHGDPGDDGKDLMVVGTLAKLPKDLFERAPLAGIDTTRISYPQLSGPKAVTDAKPVDFWSKSNPNNPSSPKNTFDHLETAAAGIRFSGTLGPQRAALMQFQHPRAQDRTIMALTAATGADLKAGGKALWDPTLQAGCQGDLSFINLAVPGGHTDSMMAGPSYFLGKADPVPVVNNFFNNHPVIMLGTLMVVMLLLFTLTLTLLRRRKRKRMAIDDDE